MPFRRRRPGSRQLPLPMELGPAVPRVPILRRDPKCLYKLDQGRYHPYFEQQPYSVCISKNQHERLFERPIVPGRPYRKPKPIGGPKHGCGVFACVYKSPHPDRVVKITNDETDVGAMQRAQAAGVEGTPKYFDMFQLATKTTSRRPVFAMEVERLQPLTRRQRFRFDNALTCIKARAGADTDERLDCCDRSEFGGRGRYKTMCRRMAQDIPKTMRALDEIGAWVTDVHTGNIGQDKHGRWKILDLGVSGRGLTYEPAILEGPRRKSRKRRRR